MAVYDIEGIRIDDGGSLFVNVKNYGAKGDGTTDDAAAIQSALDALSSNGGVVYFPNAIYLIKSQLFFYSNQTLLFEDGATILQGAAIDNLLMSYCASGTTVYNGTHDSAIVGGIFDGGAYTTDNTLIGIVHSKNIIFKNCKTKNAYGTWHNIEINSSYNVKVINCDFEGSRKTNYNGELIQIDAMSNASTWPWENNRGSIDYTVSKYVEIAHCFFHNDTIAPAIGNHSNSADKFIRIHGNVFDGLTSTRGAINLNSAENVDIYNNTFNSCTIGIGSDGSTYYIYNNRFVDVTTAISGGNVVAHANMINGTYTA